MHPGCAGAIAIDPALTIAMHVSATASRALIDGASPYIRSIIAWPKPEHDTCFAPGIKRAKS